MIRPLLLAATLAASTALAGELNGVKMPDSREVAGKALKLNGLGLRTKMVFKVYVAGLYLETPSSDPAKILGADEVRRVDMAMLRTLDKKTIVDAIKSGFDKNSKAELPKLQERLDKFCAVIPEVKEGQVLSITYVPGKGSTVEAPGGVSFTAEGKDFADALFAVWLGKVPVDDDLKKGILGGK